MGGPDENESIEFYNNQSFNDYEDDPRSYDDLEKENIDLKEQMIHQVVTLE